MQDRCYDSTGDFQSSSEGLTPSSCTKNKNMKEITPREAFDLAFEQLPKLMKEVPGDTGSANKIKVTVTIKLSKPMEIGLSVEF